MILTVKIYIGYIRQRFVFRDGRAVDGRLRCHEHRLEGEAETRQVGLNIYYFHPRNELAVHRLNHSLLLR